jgi:hypothetical protein
MMMMMMMMITIIIYPWFIIIFHLTGRYIAPIFKKASLKAF